MSAPKKLDARTETQVVALIARGETHQYILDWLKNDLGIELSQSTIAKIIGRNQEALKFMKTALVQQETTMATSLLGKTHKLLDNKLESALSLEKDLRKLQEEYDNDEIESREYYQRLDILMRRQLSVKDLTALSKESFNQSQIEAGRPTSISDNPALAKESLSAMLKAIASGDQEAQIAALFPND